MIKTMKFDSMAEINIYHTYLLKVGNHTFIYTGSIEGLKNAKARVEKQHPYQTIRVRKVE